MLFVLTLDRARIAVLSGLHERLRKHLRCDHSDHIRRWSGPHVTTSFLLCVCTCVLGHTEGLPTQLMSSAKQKKRSHNNGHNRLHAVRFPCGSL